MPPLVVMLMLPSPTYNRCFIVDESVHILPPAIHHLFYRCFIGGVRGDCLNDLCDKVMMQTRPAVSDLLLVCVQL